MRKIILVVAPVSHQPLVGLRNPTTAEEVAQAVIECAEAGAGMAHLHVRDDQGRLTDNPEAFTCTLDMIRAKCDIVIQGSTGGTPKGGIGNLSLGERARALDDPRVEVGSLNMGSVNFGDDPFINSGSDIRAWAELMKKKGIFPELEIFEPGMLETVRRMASEGFLCPPYLCAFCPGYSLPANPDVLFFMKSMLPANSLWGVNHQKMPDFSLSMTAVGMGAVYVRVGFEDGVHCAPGRIAKDNAELVQRMRDGIMGMGLEIATPADARRLFTLKARTP